MAEYTITAELETSRELTQEELTAVTNGLDKATNEHITHAKRFKQVGFSCVVDGAVVWCDELQGGQNNA